MQSTRWAKLFWENVFWAHVMISEDVFEKGRKIIHPKFLTEKSTKKSEDEEIEIIDLPVWKNGATIKWLQDEHEDREKVCLLCDCGWVSSPITLFKDYYSYKWFRISLSERNRTLLASGWHVISLSRNVRSFCPHCTKHLVVALDLREKERQSE